MRSRCYARDILNIPSASFKGDPAVAEEQMFSAVRHLDEREYRPYLHTWTYGEERMMERMEIGKRGDSIC